MSFRIVVVLLLALAACTADPSVPGEQRDIDSCTGSYLCPSVAYTGASDGGRFRTLFWTSLAHPTWSLEDPSLGEIWAVSASTDASPSGASWAVAETFAPGSTKVRAEEDGVVLEATLVVTPYEVSALQAGSARFYVPTDPTGARVACSSCHADFGDAGFLAVRQDIERFTDAEVLSAIETGAFPDGYVLQGVDHRWDLTESERAGIVPYLRSMLPKSID